MITLPWPATYMMPSAFIEISSRIAGPRTDCSFLVVVRCLSLVIHSHVYEYRPVMHVLTVCHDLSMIGGELNWSRSSAIMPIMFVFCFAFPGEIIRLVASLPDDCFCFCLVASALFSSRSGHSYGRCRNTAVAGDIFRVIGFSSLRLFSAIKPRLLIISKAL